VDLVFCQFQDLHKMSYRTGTHILATLETASNELLQDHQAFRQKINELIITYDLQKLGEVYHKFEPGGFTAVICLSESHISIHTWPEHQLINLDIYLSNYQRNNDGTVAGIYHSLQQYFQAGVQAHQTLSR